MEPKSDTQLKETMIMINDHCTQQCVSSQNNTL